jgi:hypothetical protein
MIGATTTTVITPSLPSNQFSLVLAAALQLDSLVLYSANEVLLNNIYIGVKYDVELSLMWTDAKQLMCILMREYYGMKSTFVGLNPRIYNPSNNRYFDISTQGYIPKLVALTEHFCATNVIV